jgi:hypothetical protein
MPRRCLWRSWLRRHSLSVGSAFVAALIAGGVSFGYWYFGQRPVQEKSEQRVAERQAARDAYEDSRRMVTDYGSIVHGPEIRRLPGAKARGEAALKKATRAHNHGWRLMRDGHYREAEATFGKAQEVLLRCECVPAP